MAARPPDRIHSERAPPAPYGSSVTARAGFVDALLTAPVGVMLVGLLEAEVRNSYPLPSKSDPDAVLEAAEAVRSRSFGSLVALAVDASSHMTPWNMDVAAMVAAAYRDAGARLPIAKAIEERFGIDLHQPLDRAGQQWWQSDNSVESRAPEPGHRPFSEVYGAGQFTWAGLWTVTNPPPEAHRCLANSWEMYPRPLSRWRLPVRSGAHIVEIHRPDDWSALVTRYPAPARAGEEWWELPGRHQDAESVAGLMAIPHQRAARTSIRQHLVPDWGLVAADHDGIHLSWAGFLTSEGCITDLGDGDVAMLRYWFSERTHWLTDPFGTPEPLDAPHIDEDRSDFGGVDVRRDSARRARDLQALKVQLGR